MSALVLVSLFPPTEGNSTSLTSTCFSVPYRHTNPGLTTTPMLKSIWPVKFREHIFPSEKYLIWTSLTAFPTFLIGRICFIHSPWIQIPRRQAVSPKMWFALRPLLSRPCVHLQICLLPFLSQTSCFHFPRLPHSFSGALHAPPSYIVKSDSWLLMGTTLDPFSTLSKSPSFTRL